MEVKSIKENKMGVMKITPLLFSVSIPIIISMLVQALYNIVDSIFVAQYDNVAGTGALTIAFPLQNLMIATAVGLAVGTNALLSRSLGQKDFEKANKVAGQGFFLNLCGYLIFLLLGLFFIPGYVGLQADGGLLTEYSIDYCTIVCVGSVGVFVQIVTERLLQSTGKSLLSMLVQLSGSAVNIVLDPIMIFGYFGFPEMGIKGAALATVIGQIVAAVIGILINLRFNKEITLKLKNLIPCFDILKTMLAIGVPSVMMQAIGSVMTFCMNKILIGFEGIGVEAMNVFGVYFKLQSFIFMPIFGLNNGMVPIVAYNYGARRKDRVTATIRLAGATAIAYMLLGFAVFQIFPQTLLGFFNASDVMIKVGVPALRIISLSFIFAGFSVITMAVCQALGKSIYSLITSVGRQLVVLIPVAFLFSLSGNVDLVWWAYPISEIVSLALSVIFMIRVIKKAFAEL
ncbi:MAG: MATE family efflux transporter [Ruminococcaceae bacterium]|nr:MATE family efflux transporter [Oscillospiraceae bacterium]